jgi:prophage regulatory protein
MQDQIAKSGRGLLRHRELDERGILTPLGRWRRARAGTFPVPIEIGPNSVAWFEDEIEAWIATRPRCAYRYLAPGDRPANSNKARTRRPQTPGQEEDQAPAAPREG